MNIFVLDLDQNKCAQYHTDKHCIKMILESTQMLFTSYHSTIDYTKDQNIIQKTFKHLPRLNDSWNIEPYKPTHINHPCNIWLRQSINNYIWLGELAIKLCEEKQYRYGTSHKSFELIKWLLEYLPNLPNIPLTPFAQ